MVGVPRSKGCSTCLRRKVKCDQERPACGQCKKTGYHCLGYDKALTFHNKTIKPGPIETAVVHHIKDPSRETTADDLVVLAGEFLEISCPRELDLSAFEDKFMLTCLFTNYVHGNFGSPWLDLSAEGKLGVTSRTASLAVASEFFAQFHKQPKFKVPAVELYGTSLRLMRKELADKDNSSAERFVVPIMIMITYDFLTWQSGLSCDHFHGLSRVIELCGPNRFQIEPYKSAFESAREILIMLSLHDQKRTFFECREWKSIPWSRSPARKSSANRLLDVLADIPGLFEDEVVALSSDDEEETTHLRQRILMHLSQLFEWRWAWEANNKDAATEVAIEPDENTPEIFTSPLYKTQFQYSTHTQANEIGLYNSIQMLLLRLLQDTGGLEPPDSSGLLTEQLERSQIHKATKDSALLLPGEATTPKELAIEVLRSFEYQIAAFVKHKDSMLAWVLPMALAHQLFTHEGDAGWIGRSTGMLGAAPFSVRHACLYIAQSISIFRV